ncbi:hypothetical protein ACWC5I_03840 [Kitasatospora sp. NPDC001574]
MGPLASTLTTIELFAAMNPKVVVSGHGPIADASAIDANLRYLRWVSQLAKDGKATGLTPLELARETDLGDFADLTEPERLVANLHRACSELDGHPLGEPLPVDPSSRT